MKTKLKKTYGKNAVESCTCAKCSGIIMSVFAGVCTKENDGDSS